MSVPNIPYHPVPLDNGPLSPGLLSTPPVESESMSSSDLDVLAPRFPQGNSIEFRDSLMSQTTFHTPPSVVNSSVYALRPDSTGPTEFVQYKDDPAPTTTPSDPVPYLAQKHLDYASPRKRLRNKILLFGSIAAVVVVIAVIVPVYLLVIKPKSASNAAASVPSTSSPATSTGSNALVTGGNGSTITTENGTTFIYINELGGSWYWDPNDPFNNNAQSNSWTPPLNQTFNFGIDGIFGSVLFFEAAGLHCLICVHHQVLTSAVGLLQNQ